MTKRFATRTWPPASSAPPVALVQDPAMREILRIVSRSLNAICTVINKHIGPEPADDS